MIQVENPFVFGIQIENWHQKNPTLKVKTSTTLVRNLISFHFLETRGYISFLIALSQSYERPTVSVTTFGTLFNPFIVRKHGTDKFKRQKNAYVYDACIFFSFAV